MNKETLLTQEEVNNLPYGTQVNVLWSGDMTDTIHTYSVKPRKDADGSVTYPMALMPCSEAFVKPLDNVGKDSHNNWVQLHVEEQPISSKAKDIVDEYFNTSAGRIKIANALTQHMRFTNVSPLQQDHLDEIAAKDEAYASEVIPHSRTDAELEDLRKQVDDAIIIDPNRSLSTAHAWWPVPIRTELTMLGPDEPPEPVCPILFENDYELLVHPCDKPQTLADDLELCRQTGDRLVLDSQIIHPDTFFPEDILALTTDSQENRDKILAAMYGAMLTPKRVVRDYKPSVTSDIACPITGGSINSGTAGISMSMFDYIRKKEDERTFKAIDEAIAKSKRPSVYNLPYGHDLAQHMLYNPKSSFSIGSIVKSPTEPEVEALLDKVKQASEYTSEGLFNSDDTKPNDGTLTTRRDFTSLPNKMFYGIDKGKDSDTLVISHLKKRSIESPPQVINWWGWDLADGRDSTHVEIAMQLPDPVHSIELTAPVCTKIRIPLNANMSEDKLCLAITKALSGILQEHQFKDITEVYAPRFWIGVMVTMKDKLVQVYLENGKGYLDVVGFCEHVPITTGGPWEEDYHITFKLKRGG